MIRLRLLSVLALIAIAPGCGTDQSTSPADEGIKARFDVSPDNGTVLTEFTFNARRSSADEGGLGRAMAFGTPTGRVPPKQLTGTRYMGAMV